MLFKVALWSRGLSKVKSTEADPAGLVMRRDLRTAIISEKSDSNSRQSCKSSKKLQWFFSEEPLNFRFGPNLENLATRLGSNSDSNYALPLRSVFFNRFNFCHGFLGTRTRYQQTVFCIVFLAVSSISENYGFFPDVVDDVIAISGPCKSQIFKLQKISAVIPQTTAKRLLTSFLALSSHPCIANWTNS